MSPDQDEQDIRDPSKEGWLSDICSLPEETLVTPSGTYKLPWGPRKYSNGDKSLSLTRADYKAWTRELIGYEIDPAQVWFIEMGHGGTIPSDA
jgi:hypothetical protein